VQVKEIFLLFFHDLLLIGTNLKNLCSNVTADKHSFLQNIENGDLKKEPILNP
jgi:hypothetical protein